MTAVEKFKREHSKMEALQHKLRKWGADDTEPDWHYQDQVRNALFGKAPMILTAREWELFSDIPGAARAASQMSTQTLRVCTVVLNCKVSELGAVKEYMREFFWRVDLDRKPMEGNIRKPDEILHER
jgi:hypothetical protein